MNVCNLCFSIAPIIVKRLIQPWLYLQPIYMFTKMYWDEKLCLKTLHTFTKDVIEEREKHFQMSDVENLENNSNSEEEICFSKKKKRLAMLDLLLSSKKNGLIDSHGIREEVDTFMFAVGKRFFF